MNRHSDKTPPTEPLKNRIIKAIINRLHTNDPLITISVGDNQITITWEQPNGNV